MKNYFFTVFDVHVNLWPFVLFFKMFKYVFSKIKAFCLVLEFLPDLWLAGVLYVTLSSLENLELEKCQVRWEDYKEASFIPTTLKHQELYQILYWKTVRYVCVCARALMLVKGAHTCAYVSLYWVQLHASVTTHQALFLFIGDSSFWPGTHKIG